MRIAVLGGIALTLLGLLLIRLWFLQVISGEQYAEAAEGNRLRTVVTDAPRGKVLDRNGELLVGNRTGHRPGRQPARADRRAPRAGAEPARRPSSTA